MKTTIAGLFCCLALVSFAACGSDGPKPSDNTNDGDSDTPVTYALTLTPGANGSVVADATGPYASGTVVTLTATPAAGYKVGAWTGTSDDTSTSPLNHVTMSAVKTVTVSFVAVSTEQFALTLTQNDNGTIAATPASATYLDGTTVTLTATPASGYRVASWTGTNNDASKGTTNAVTMTAAKTVSATFEVAPLQYTLIVTQSVFGGGDWGFTATPPGTKYTDTTTTLQYDAGTVVTLHGVSAVHWPFDGFSGDVPVGDQQKCTITITMDSDKNITANIPDSPAASTCTGS